MGLIKAIVQGGKSTLADQWIEYFYCDSMSNEVLVQRAHHQVNKGSNTKGNENIITNGSGFAINEGQAMVIVEDGKVIDFSTEPGRYTWEQSSEPSMFDNGFAGLKESFKIFGKRITYGGDAGKDQRVYFINLKEIFDNKFGTSTPMAYKDPTYRGIYIRYFGTYTFRIEDPIIFYANISGNIQETYTKDELMEQCDAEFMNALDETLAKCSDNGYQYNDLPKRQREIATIMNDSLDDEWSRRRGMVVESVAIVKVTPDDESRKRMEKIDDAIMMGDSRVAAGRLAQAQANAMENAASNEAGALNGFLGMGMANMAGANSATVLQNMGIDENNSLFKQATPKDTWTCACGSENSGKFCSECGTSKPETKTWTCVCGAENKGKFCSECGTSRPQSGFTCSNESCGFTSEKDMKFCPDCGSPNKK